MLIKKIKCQWKYLYWSIILNGQFSDSSINWASDNGLSRVVDCHLITSVKHSIQQTIGSSIRQITAVHCIGSINANRLATRAYLRVTQCRQTFEFLATQFRTTQTIKGIVVTASNVKSFQERTWLVNGGGLSRIYLMRLMLVSWCWYKQWPDPWLQDAVNPLL